MKDKSKKPDKKASLTFQGTVEMKGELEQFARTKDLWHGEAGNITKAINILLRYALAHVDEAWKWYANGGK